MEMTITLVAMFATLSTSIWMLTQSINVWRGWAKEKSQRKLEKR
jgi:hypothetical protein